MRFLLLSLALFSHPAHAWYEAFASHFTIHSGSTEIQVGVMGSGSAGTLVYLHGFADTMDNHDALLRGFANQGLKVVAFDYPEHGESSGSIRFWGLKELAELIPVVLADERVGYNPSSPIVLAGWSTGATIAIRIAQAWQSSALPQGARLAGVIAFAPALPAKVVIKVDASELTSGRMKHGPQPSSVPILGQFSGSITMQSKIAAHTNIPGNVPALIVVAGNDEDKFAHSADAAYFVKSSGEHVVGFQCHGAKHGIEFEPQHGAEARSIAVQFAAAAARGDTANFNASGRACPRISKQ